MTEKMIVTPYEVEGEVDYQRLIKEFGLQEITPEILEKIKKITKDLHPMLKRKIFFYAHLLHT